MRDLRCMDTLLELMPTIECTIYTARQRMKSVHY